MHKLVYESQGNKYTLIGPDGSEVMICVGDKQENLDTILSRADQIIGAIEKRGQVFDNIAINSALRELFPGKEVSLADISDVRGFPYFFQQFTKMTYQFPIYLGLVMHQDLEYHGGQSEQSAYEGVFDPLAKHISKLCGRFSDKQRPERAKYFPPSSLYFLDEIHVDGFKVLDSFLDMKWRRLSIPTNPFKWGLHQVIFDGQTVRLGDPEETAAIVYKIHERRQLPK